MGRNKAWVELDGKPLVLRVIEALRRVCDEIIVVVNDTTGYEQLGVRLTGDVFPNTGSLGGIYSGLRAAKNEFAIAVACDMPFLNPALLEYLLGLAPGFDAVIPSVPDERKAQQKKDKGEARPKTAKDFHLHPLHAVYAKTCLSAMEQAIRREDLRMISFHDAVRVRIVEASELDSRDPQRLSFWNVNTPGELARAEEFLRRETHAKSWRT